MQRLASDRVRCDHPFVRGNMCELQPANDVTHRVEVRFRRLHLGINLDESALSDRLSVFQADLNAIRHTPSGDNQHLRAQCDCLSPVDRLNLQVYTVGTFDERALLDAMSNVDRNAALRERARQLFRGVAVFQRNKCWQHLNDGGLGAEITEVGGELTANGATADHNHTGRLQRPRGDLIAINDHASICLKAWDATYA